ncbi:unnamed protein product [marine sediment metagenome]|uniref:Uncharacterized protein n=1 Tax=marine sediment metagenome TaxID=412755 RepID=X1DRU9_9ZZZZ
MEKQKEQFDKVLKKRFVMHTYENDRSYRGNHLVINNRIL